MALFKDEPVKKQVFVQRIIKWYQEHGRKNLPWRNVRDSWHVLVAGFLLRKTTVNQILKIYPAVLKKYPKPHALLNTSVAEIENLIRPLGIEQQRARHLRDLAEVVAEKFGGRIPSSKEELKKLPGVGDYIASEVLLTAHEKSEPLLDRNMIRVVERVFGVRSDRPRPHTDPWMWSFVRTLVPEDHHRAKSFNYGVLDFAALVCTARNPNCSACIMLDICNCAVKQGMPKR